MTVKTTMAIRSFTAMTLFVAKGNVDKDDIDGSDYTNRDDGHYDHDDVGSRTVSPATAVKRLIIRCDSLPVERELLHPAGASDAAYGTTDCRACALHPLWIEQMHVVCTGGDAASKDARTFQVVGRP